MSQTRDKRRRLDLDLFALALIDGGLSNPYALQKTAGISPGASIPALQRLTEAGYVRPGKPGLRGRTDYKITAAGKKALKSGWRDLIAGGPSGDLDADLRVALLALSIGGERRLATEFLKQSAQKRLAALKSLAECVEYASDSPLANSYAQLRMGPGMAVLKAEAAAALKMAKALPRTLPRNFRRPET
jgi:DNA-binding PadR family transcriptional regulator